MKKQSLIIFLLLLCLSSNAQAWWGEKDNYWQCLLNELTDVKNDIAAESIINQCKDQHPIHTRVFVKKNTSWFGYSTAKHCVNSKAKSLRSDVAAQFIEAACYKLYPN